MFITIRYHYFERNSVGFWVFTSIYFGITLFTFGWLFRLFAPPDNFIIYCRAFLFIVYLSKAVFLVPILIDDLRRVILWIAGNVNKSANYDPSRSRFMAHFALFLGALPLTSLLYGMVRNPYRYKVYKQKIIVPGLPDKLKGLRIVQISDIHSGSFTFKEPVENAIQMINDLNPDLFFFTGDMVNDKAEEMMPFVEMFQGIKSKYGKYSVLGNHDYGDYVRWESPAAKSANMDQLEKVHEDIGFDLLRNEHRRINIEGFDLAIIGVENYSALPRFPKHGDLTQAYSGCEDCSFKVLLSHDPSHWRYEVTKDFSSIDLTLSGHTHGFQFGIEVPGFIKWSPSKYIYEEWAGLYQEGRQYLYVNRGLGFLGYPGRVGILPEITLLELT